MHTPFDSALRVQKRAMDAIRLSLLSELAREQALTELRIELDSTIAREAAIAASNWQVGAHPYSHRLRSKRVRLEHEHRDCDAKIDGLRNEAMEACGQMVAINSAARAYVATSNQRMVAAEQAQADDLGGARHARARRTTMHQETAP